MKPRLQTACPGKERSRNVLFISIQLWHHERLDKIRKSNMSARLNTARLLYGMTRGVRFEARAARGKKLMSVEIVVKPTMPGHDYLLKLMSVSRAAKIKLDGIGGRGRRGDESERAPWPEIVRL